MNPLQNWLQEKTCYCVMDVLVSTVSTSSHLLSINHCNGENRTGNGTVMNLHKRHEGMYKCSQCPIQIESYTVSNKRRNEFSF